MDFHAIIPPGWNSARAVGWAPGLPRSGFQLGYEHSSGDDSIFEPITASPVFATRDEALAHARLTGWI